MLGKSDCRVEIGYEADCVVQGIKKDLISGSDAFASGNYE